jgi:hydrogenase maturation protein HypF
MLDDSVARLCNSLDVQPEIVAYDLHPDFYSTQFAQSYAAQRGLPVIAVQHHHAHIAALGAEHHIHDAVLGLALDGVGLGADDTVGGELLRARCGFDRLGHQAPLACPAATAPRANRGAWRRRCCSNWGVATRIAQRFPNQPGAQTVAAMLQRNLNCPATSSTGRLFDAAAGLLGVSEIQAFEAQAAIRCRNGATDRCPLEDGFQIDENGVLDFAPLLAVPALPQSKQ